MNREDAAVAGFDAEDFQATVRPKNSNPVWPARLIHGILSARGNQHGTCQQARRRRWRGDELQAISSKRAEDRGTICPFFHFGLRRERSRYPTKVSLAFWQVLKTSSRRTSKLQPESSVCKRSSNSGLMSRCDSPFEDSLLLLDQSETASSRTRLRNSER